MSPDIPNLTRTTLRLIELFKKTMPDLPPADQVARVMDEGLRHSALFEAFEDQVTRLRDMATEGQAMLKRVRGAQ